MEEDHSTTLATLGAQMQYLRQDVERQAKLLQEINTSLRSLTVVEIHQGQILTALSKGEGEMRELDARLATVEMAMPSLLETRRWIVAGVIAVVAMMGAAIFQLTVLGPALQMQLLNSKPKAHAEAQP